MGDHYYRIELGDRAIETDDKEFAERLGWGETTDPAIDEQRLEELCQAWERKSGNSRRYSPDVRAAYCDAAEKLRFVLNGTPWMESP